MAFVNKGKVRILRGNLQNDNPNDVVGNTTLWDGQPFYDKQSGKLYIGDTNTKKIKETKPIVADANNIVFNCKRNGDTLTCTNPGYKVIEDQRAFFICDSDISANRNGIELSIDGNSTEVLPNSNGIKANVLYNIHAIKENDTYKWEISNIRTTETDYALYYSLICGKTSNTSNGHPVFEIEQNIDDNFFKTSGGHFAITFHGGVPQDGDVLKFKNGQEYSMDVDSYISDPMMEWYIYRGSYNENSGKIMIQPLSTSNAYYAQEAINATNDGQGDNITTTYPKIKEIGINLSGTIIGGDPKYFIGNANSYIAVKCLIVNNEIIYIWPYFISEISESYNDLNYITLKINNANDPNLKIGIKNIKFIQWNTKITPTLSGTTQQDNFNYVGNQNLYYYQHIPSGGTINNIQGPNPISNSECMYIDLNGGKWDIPGGINNFQRLEIDFM